MMQIVFIFIFVDSSWSKRQLFIKSFLQCERWRNFADKKRLWTSIDLQNLRANLKNSFKKRRIDVLVSVFVGKEKYQPKIKEKFGFDTWRALHSCNMNRVITSLVLTLIVFVQTIKSDILVYSQYSNQVNGKSVQIIYDNKGHSFNVCSI